MHGWLLVLAAAFFCAGHNAMSQTAATDPHNAVSVSALNRVAQEVLATRHPKIVLSDFYLQRVSHEMFLSPDGKTEMEAYNLMFRLRSDRPSSTPLSKQEIVAIHIELDAKMAVRRLLLIPRDVGSRGSISVPLTPDEDATLVNEGILPPKP